MRHSHDEKSASSHHGSLGDRSLALTKQERPRHSTSMPIDPQTSTSKGAIISRKDYALTSRPRYERDPDESYANFSGDNRPCTPEEIKGSLNTLFGNVKLALSFFGDFRESFDKDLSHVPYASEPDRLWLWKHKIDFSNGNGEAADRAIAEGRFSAEGSHRFNNVASQLKVSLHLALKATENGLSEQDDIMASKLRRAEKDILNHLSNAMQHVQDMKPLTIELDLLAVLLDRNGAVLTNSNAKDQKFSFEQLEDDAEPITKSRSIDSGFAETLSSHTGAQQQVESGDHNRPAASRAATSQTSER